MQPLSIRERLRIVPLVGLYRWIGPAKPVVTATVNAMLSASAQQELPDAVEIITSTLRRAQRDGFLLTMKSVMLGRPDLADILPDVQAPALLIVGVDDPMTTPADAHAAAAQLRQARVHVAAASRHLPALETPEDVAKAVRSFWLEREPARRPRTQVTDR